MTQTMALPLEPGATFNRWTVVGAAPPHPTRGSARVECRCVCGSVRVVDRYGLVSGHTKSCGCIKVERALALVATKPGRTHGLTRTPEHAAWQNMLARCERPQHPGYADYGGRGIRVCAAWRDSFDTFLADVGPRPSPRHSLDRRDNESGYEPGNVRWATATEQQRNSRHNRRVTFRGETMPLVAFCDRVGVPWKRAWGRLELGWTPEEIVAGRRQAASLGGYGNGQA